MLILREGNETKIGVHISRSQENSSLRGAITWWTCPDYLQVFEAVGLLI